jgi:RNA polymerase sigma factor (TIGR02999 family)
MSRVTQLLEAIDGGDPQAASALFPVVYDELRRLASQHLAREVPGQTLQPTALVHEAYLRLLAPKTDAVQYTQRSHFFAAAAQAMRRILIEQARRRLSAKRGGGLDRQDLTDVAAPRPDEELIAVEEALQRLAEIDPIKARLVELRFFAGLTGQQAAAVLNISPATADRYWAYARAWLQTEVRG